MTKKLGLEKLDGTEMVDLEGVMRLRIKTETGSRFTIVVQENHLVVTAWSGALVVKPQASNVVYLFEEHF